MESHRYELTLTQQGDLIEGLACSMTYGVVPIAVRNVTVSGRYPNVRFEFVGNVMINGEPRFAVSSFSGSFSEPRSDRGQSGFHAFTLQPSQFRRTLR